MGELMFIIAIGVFFIFLMNGFNKHGVIKDLKDKFSIFLATLIGIIFFITLSSIYQECNTGFDITFKEYKLLRINEEFVFYEKDGKNSVIDFTDENKPIKIIPSNENKVVFKERDYDEGNFLNSILWTPSSTEIKIYIKTDGFED